MYCMFILIFFIFALRTYLRSRFGASETLVFVGVVAVAGGLCRDGADRNAA